MATTTDLFKLAQGGWKFTWGKIIRIHSVGDRYAIVEYYSNGFVNGHATGKVDYNDVRFHTYIDGVDTSHSYHTFDEALIGLVTHGNMNPNEARYADLFIDRIINGGK